MYVYCCLSLNYAFYTHNLLPMDAFICHEILEICLVDYNGSIKECF